MDSKKFKTTKEIFILFSRIALMRKGILKTTYYGKTDMHKVEFIIRENGKNSFKAKQTADSLNYALNKLFFRILEKLELTENDLI